MLTFYDAICFVLYTKPETGVLLELSLLVNKCNNKDSGQSDFMLVNILFLSYNKRRV